MTEELDEVRLVYTKEVYQVSLTIEWFFRTRLDQCFSYQVKQDSRNAKDTYGCHGPTTTILN